MRQLVDIVRAQKAVTAAQIADFRLAYRLGKMARYSQRTDAAVLTLSYPLKIVSLKAPWKRVMQMLSSGEWVRMDKLAKKAPVNYDNAVSFLDGLTARGYLESRGARRLSSYPSVSIIIPVHNRPKDLYRCLRSIDQLKYPRYKLETIVVDDASTDHTARVASLQGAKLLSMSKNRGASFCRNRGAKAAKGELLAFVDSDCQVSPNWLRELVPSFQNRAVVILGGSIDGYYQCGSLDKYEHVKSSLRMGNRLRRSDVDDKSFYVPSCNMLIRRDEFLECGGFNEGLQVGEDVDLCWRLQDMGHLLEYRPSGSVLHRHRTKWKSFCDRRFDYGTSEPLLQKLHPNRPKRFPLLPGVLLFWAGVAACFVFQTALLGLLPCIVLLGDVLLKFRKIINKHLPIKFGKVLMSVIGTHIAFVIHLCKFISRYYLLQALLLLPLGVFLPLGIFTAHLLSGITEYLNCRPRINLLSFMWWFTLEQVSYQGGVWCGCLRQTYFRPLIPKPFLARGV